LVRLVSPIEGSSASVWDRLASTEVMVTGALELCSELAAGAGR